MKSTFFNTLCFLNISIAFCIQENVLNSTLLKKYAFVNAPKEWHRYLIKYLEMKLTSFIRLQNLLEQYIFLKTETLPGDISQKSSMENIMMYPKGLTRRTRKMSDNQEDKIVFVLDRKLRLNLTFHHIHFGFRNLHDCSVGQVTVISHSNMEQVHKYCGIYSNLINYPQNRYVSVTSTTFAGVYIKEAHIFNVSIFYSVIDTKRIITLPQLKFLKTNLIWNLYLEQYDVRVLRFYITTKKYQLLMINFTVDSNMTVELYDGPGTLSTNIYMYNEEFYKLSTFQCIIHLWMASARNLNPEGGFRFVTISNTVDRSIRLDDYLTYKTSYTAGKLEIWKIVSSSNVNLKIEYLTYTYYNDPQCSFAGIAVYALKNYTYAEIGTECLTRYKHLIPRSKEKITKDSLPFDNLLTHRDFYSQSNETLLGLYSYKQYGNLKITIQLSTTRCKPVTINTCVLTSLCKSPNNNVCKKHRDQIRSLNLKYKHISTNFPVSVNPGECLILQMVAVIDRLTRSNAFTDCEITFHHIDIFTREISIQFNINASLHSKYLRQLKSAEDKLRLKYDYVYIIALLLIYSLLNILCLQL